jgi:hypothetical protein
MNAPPYLASPASWLTRDAARSSAQRVPVADVALTTHTWDGHRDSGRDCRAPLKIRPRLAARLPAAAQLKIVNSLLEIDCTRLTRMR